MKKFLLKIINILSRPFIGSGIGKYPPFSWIYKFAHNSVKKGYAIYDTHYGFKMYLDGSKYIDRTIIVSGIWDPQIAKPMKEYIKKGDVFLDIGANIGYFTLMASQLVGEKGKVIAFEPSTSIFQELERNIKLNEYSNIEVHKLGVGDKKSENEIIYDELNPGGSSIVRKNVSKKAPKEKIQIVKLDDFLKDEKRIDFVKMDIEGFEYEAIIGMENMLKSKNIKMVFEFSPLIYDSKEHSIKLLNKLKELNFDLYDINANGSIKKINDYDSYYEDIVSKHEGQSNMLCLKN